MFSDGMEGYDNCSACNGIFPRPLEDTMNVGKWIEMLGPGVLDIDPKEQLETVIKKHYEGYTKEDQVAMRRGLCSNECLINNLDKENDGLELQLSRARERINDLKISIEEADKEIALTKERLRREQKVSTELESSREHASDELMNIKVHPYKYAFSELRISYKIKRFFRTNSFSEFVCKYLIVLLVGLILYETISRI